MNRLPYIFRLRETVQASGVKIRVSQKLIDSAVDIAKEASDIILLETSLAVLEQGVEEGRRIFGKDS